MEDVVFKKNDTRLRYITIGGLIFFKKSEADNHNRMVSKANYYKHLLEKRNWIQRLFNIKPSMKLYDEMWAKIKYI